MFLFHSVNEHTCPKCSSRADEVIDMFPSVCDYQKKTQQTVFASLDSLINTLGDTQSSTFNECANKLLGSMDTLAESIIDGLILAHTKLIHLKNVEKKLRLVQKKAAGIKRLSMRKSNVIRGRDLMIQHLQAKIKDLKRRQQ